MMSGSGTGDWGPRPHFSKVVILLPTFCLRIHQNTPFRDQEIQNSAPHSNLHAAVGPRRAPSTVWSHMASSSEMEFRLIKLLFLTKS